MAGRAYRALSIEVRGVELQPGDEPGPLYFAGEGKNWQVHRQRIYFANDELCFAELSWQPGSAVVMSLQGLERVSSRDLLRKVPLLLRALRKLTSVNKLGRPVGVSTRKQRAISCERLRKEVPIHIREIDGQDLLPTLERVAKRLGLGSAKTLQRRQEACGEKRSWVEQRRDALKE